MERTVFPTLVMLDVLATSCYSGPPCGPGQVLDALQKSETCTFQRSFWAVTPHERTDSLTHTHTVLLHVGGRAPDSPGTFSLQQPRL
jgi:hypothetical protein